MSQEDFLDSNDVENVDYLESVQEIILCSICRGILRNPQQCNKCSNNFCTDCISSWISKSNSCPFRCSDFKMEKAPRTIQTLLDKLVFKGQGKANSNGEGNQQPSMQSNFIQDLRQQFRPLPNAIRKKIIFKNGNYYDGEFLNDKKEGFGFFKWVNRTVYEGYFKNNQKHGQGRYCYPSGNSYEGEWSEDKKEGYGVYRWKNGDIYEGFFKNDMIHGKGKKTMANGDSYDGGFVKNAKEGYGTFKFGLGHMYIGEYKGDLRNGKGKYSCPDGSNYDGMWVDDCKEGFGLFKGADGDTYEGHYKKGKRHGKGKRIYPNGDTYEGLWNEDKKHGQGTYTLANGDIYEGKYANDLRTTSVALAHSASTKAYSASKKEAIPAGESNKDQPIAVIESKVEEKANAERNAEANVDEAQIKTVATESNDPVTNKEHKLKKDDKEEGKIKCNCIIY